MRVKNRYLLFALFLFTHTGYTQKKIILEQITCYSSVGPIMNYWQNDQVRASFIKDLRQVLLTKANLSLPDSLKVPPITIAGSLKDVENSRKIFTNPDTTVLHLYLDIDEIDPISFFSKVYKNSRDTALIKRSRSVFILEAWLFNSKKILFSTNRLI